MAIKEEVEALFKQLLGPSMAGCLDVFENPDKYPKDFLDECADFLGKFIGADSAKKKLEPLYRKYAKTTNAKYKG